MRKLLLALLLLFPGQALAGPPEGVPGRMVYVDVADGLRKYRQETDPDKRAERLAALAPIIDPRVAVALGEALTDPAVQVAAMRGISAYYGAGCFTPVEVGRWWEKNEADLRRRAKELSR